MSLKTRTEFFQRIDVRLTVYYTLVCIILFLGIYTSFYFILEHNLTGHIDNILLDEEHELIQELNETAEDGLPLITGCQDFMEDVSGRKHFPIFFRVFSSSNELIYQSENSKNIPLPEFHDSPRNESFPNNSLPAIRVHETTAAIQGTQETVFIQLATVTALSEIILKKWFRNALMVFPILILTCIGGGALVSFRPKKIIGNITNLTNRISSQHLKERLIVPDAKDEIRDLTITINTMLDRLDESFSQIKQFSADVSHELRNPLFALQGELEVAISKQRSKEEYKDIMGNCIERIQFLSKMVKDLFMISNFDTNKIPLQLTSVDLRELLLEIHAFFLPMAQEKGIRFSVEINRPIVFKADKTKFLQLLNNLLENAVKFTNENGVITLSANVNTHAQQVEIKVKDSGIGIPESELTKIFNRFYQVDKSRSDFQYGAGLGLHICQRIAEIHGGSISAESSLEKGATFTIILPKVIS